jgi:hypothetical protein
VPPALPHGPAGTVAAGLGHLCKRPFTDVLLICKNRPYGVDIAPMAAIPRKSPPAGRLIGYARVSTDDQGTDPQLDELQAAGCAEILEEHASGADRSRPVLARLLRTIKAGDTLVVFRLDRLACSVSHLLAVPRGGTRWHPSSVKHLLARAQRLGVARAATPRDRAPNPL